MRFAEPDILPFIGTVFLHFFRMVGKPADAGASPARRPGSGLSTFPGKLPAPGPAGPRPAFHGLCPGRPQWGYEWEVKTEGREIISP